MRCHFPYGRSSDLKCGGLNACVLPEKSVNAATAATAAGAVRLLAVSSLLDASGFPDKRTVRKYLFLKIITVCKVVSQALLAAIV